MAVTAMAGTFLSLKPESTPCHELIATVIMQVATLIAR